MFKRYRNAEVCIAYLPDVNTTQIGSHFLNSEWFERGWTLQELIAPATVTFYDYRWHMIGTKAQWAEGIEKITRIPADVLTGRSSWTQWTVAQRLSWAAGRQTKKLEDRAHSLLGLFRINMSPLYGEGHKAFCRLQLEILQKHPDDSILSWTSKYCHGPENVLARSPDDFQGCLHTQPVSLLHRDPPTFSPTRVTSWGTELRANAHKLWPLPECRSISVNNQQHRFLWALRMMVGWEGRFEELPCILILAQSRPARYNYRRLECLHSTWRAARVHLQKIYRVDTLESDTEFYLQFDDDLDS